MFHFKVLSRPNQTVFPGRFGLGVWILALLLCSFNTASAQFKNASRDSHTDVSFATGVQLTLQGTKVFNEFKLVDDLGFAYDTMSVLKDEKIRDELALTDQQFETMSKMKTQMTSALMSEIVKGMESEEKARLLEAKVKAHELEIRNVLNLTQQTRLEQVKTQLRLENYGAEQLAQSRYLESELGLTPEQVQSVRERCSELSRRHKTMVAGWNEQANEQLLKMLSAKQLRELTTAVDKEFLARWKKQQLFTGKPKRRFRRVPSVLAASHLLKDAQVREMIELTDSQIEKLEQLNAEMDSQLKAQVDELLSDSGKTLTISQRGKQLVKLNADNRAQYAAKAAKFLLKHQAQQLLELAIKRETSKEGTVQCICNGTIGEKTSLDDNQAEKIFRRASELHQDLQKKITQATNSLNQDILELFPGFDQAERLGAPVQLKRR